MLQHHHQTTARAPIHPAEDGRKASASVYYPRMQGSLTGRSAHKRTILLIVPEPGVGTRLAHLLQNDDYAVFTVTETAAAMALLASHPIALIIIHYTTQIGAMAWESYDNLRQQTNKPVIMINDLSATHFTQIVRQPRQAQCHGTGETYRRFVNLLWATVVGMK